MDGVDLRADLADDRLLGVAAGDLGADGDLVVLMGIGASKRQRDGGGGRDSLRLYALRRGRCYFCCSASIRVGRRR